MPKRLSFLTKMNVMVRVYWHCFTQTPWTIAGLAWKMIQEAQVCYGDRVNIKYTLYIDFNIPGRTFKIGFTKMTPEL